MTTYIEARYIQAGDTLSPPDASWHGPTWVAVTDANPAYGPHGLPGVEITVEYPDGAQGKRWWPDGARVPHIIPLQGRLL